MRLIQLKLLWKNQVRQCLILHDLIAAIQDKKLSVSVKKEYREFFLCQLTFSSKEFISLYNTFESGAFITTAMYVLSFLFVNA